MATALFSPRFLHLFSLFFDLSDQSLQKPRTDLDRQVVCLRKTPVPVIFKMKDLVIDHLYVLVI